MHAAVAHLHLQSTTAICSNRQPLLQCPGADSSSETTSEARSASPPRAAGSPGTTRPPLAQPAGLSTRRLSALMPPSAQSSGAADIPSDTTRSVSGAVGLETVSENAESSHHGSGRTSHGVGSSSPGTDWTPQARAAAASAGLTVQPPGTFSTTQSPFARMVASTAAARGSVGGPPAPDPRNMYNTALEALRAKAVGPQPLAVQSEPVRMLRCMARTLQMQQTSAQSRRAPLLGGCTHLVTSWHTPERYSQHLNSMASVVLVAVLHLDAKSRSDKLQYVTI